LEENKMPPEEENPKTQKRDWVEILLKISTPLITGIVIAGIGVYSNQTLRDLSEKEENARTARADQAELARATLSSREESARLITQLQVQREQAETALRKDIFDKALEALFSKNQDDGSAQGLSKRLLRLELLALNFGDSLSLSPLFKEFKRDLQYALSVNKGKPSFVEQIPILRNRLLGLAKRVASGQLSALGQHGDTIEFTVPLDRKKIEEGHCPGADKLLDNGNDYKWPDDAINASIQEIETQMKQQDPGINQEDLNNTIAQLRDGYTENILKLDGVIRHINVVISNVDRCKKTAIVGLSIDREDPPMPTHQHERDPNAEVHNEIVLTPEVAYQEFQLDFYNFPVVDNTRLTNNHRFAIVMEDFNDKFLDTQPEIVISGVIFPAEYASLRDRPGMEEAMQLLQSALHLENTPSATKDSLAKQKE
jgi:hypothetical protein